MLGIIILTSLLQAHFLLWPDVPSCFFKSSSSCLSPAEPCPCPASLRALHAPVWPLGLQNIWRRTRASTCSPPPPVNSKRNGAQHLQGAYAADPPSIPSIVLLPKQRAGRWALERQLAWCADRMDPWRSFSLLYKERKEERKEGRREENRRQSPKLTCFCHLEIRFLEKNCHLTPSWRWSYAESFCHKAVWTSAVGELYTPALQNNPGCGHVDVCVRLFILPLGCGSSPARWHQSSSSSGCPNVLVVFRIPWPWLCPCLELSSHTWKWGSGQVVPMLAWGRLHKYRSALLAASSACPFGNSFCAVEPSCCLKKLHSEQCCGWNPSDKNLEGIFILAGCSENLLGHGSETSMGEYFISFSLCSLVCNGLGRNCLFLRVFSVPKSSNFSFLPVIARENRLFCRSVFNVQFHRPNGHLMVQIDLIPDLDLLT